MLADRYDLLPLLVLRYGKRLRPELESVFVVWRGTGEVSLEYTTIDVRGFRTSTNERNALSSAADADNAFDAIAATLLMDSYSRINVGNISPEEEAIRIDEHYRRTGESGG